MSKPKTVTITQKEYDALLKADRELNALECYGVDNWGGYGDAMSSLDEDEDDEDEQRIGNFRQW